MNITEWDFNHIPEGYEKKVANMTIKAFPALVDKNMFDRYAFREITDNFCRKLTVAFSFGKIMFQYKIIICFAMKSF